jgi:hypothetical protein
MQVHIIGSTRSRRDTTTIAARVPLDVAQRLSMLAAEEDTTVEALLTHAISLLVGEIVTAEAD